MSIVCKKGPGFYGGGYIDKDGKWIKMKHCFMYCGPERCDCTDPRLKRPSLEATNNRRRNNVEE